MSGHVPIDVYFLDVSESRFPFDEEVIKLWLHDLALFHHRPIEALTFVFCSDPYLLDINMRHLGHDYYTDILTFPYSYDPISAEIYLSLDRIEDNASSLGCPPADEVLRVMCHGVLHMLGYNDHTTEDQQKMREKEDWAIQRFRS